MTYRDWARKGRNVWSHVKEYAPLYVSGTLGVGWVSFIIILGVVTGWK